ncbi:MAG: hypothetical protein M4D80_29555 [Myxococcota bacterium]|nr:hypothetical protein [Myxococcota bacterium]
MALVLGLVAGCDDGDDGSLLSTSRLSLRERERATVQVDAKSFTVEAPPEFQIEPGTSSFTVTPSCNAAPGMDTTVPITIRSGGRTATLVVAVIDDAGPDCLADIEIWEEPCTDIPDTCTQACGDKPATSSSRFDFARNTSHRICVRAVPLDRTRPISSELAIVPDTGAFTDRDTRRIVVRGRDWLVGPFEVVFSAQSSGITATRRVPMNIGVDGDIGLEVTKPAQMQELARGQIPLTVHRMGDPPCALRAPMAPGPTSPGFAGRVYGEDAFIEYGGLQSLPCDTAAHVPFVLSVVPMAFAPSVLHVNVLVNETRTEVAMNVTSRIEDLMPPFVTCGSTRNRLACADLDGNDDLEIVIGDGAQSCVTTLPGFRHAQEPYPSTGATVIDQVFTLPTSPPKVYGTDTSGRLYVLDPVTPSWTSINDKPVGQRVTAVRSTATGTVDRWVGVESAKQLRISSLDVGVTSAVDIPNADASFVALAVIGVGRVAPQRLVVVGTVTGGYHAYLFAVNWLVQPPLLTRVAPPLVLDTMPPGATIRLATREHGPNHDVIASFLSGVFQNAVTEIDLSFNGFAESTRYGGVRSVASANGPALIGATTGAQLTQVVTDVATYRPIDPLAAPSNDYGDGIAPCFDKSGKLAGYAVNAGSGIVRISRTDVTLETP